MCLGSQCVKLYVWMVGAGPQPGLALVLSCFVRART